MLIAKEKNESELSKLIFNIINVLILITVLFRLFLIGI